MLNQVVVVGRLVKDLEVKKLESDKKVCELTLAVQREFKNYDGEYDVDFIKCQLWDSLAESCASYARKGNMLAVKGRLSVKKTEVKDTKINLIEFIGTRVVYLSSNQKELNKEQE